MLKFVLALVIFCAVGCQAPDSKPTLRLLDISPDRWTDDAIPTIRLRFDRPVVKPDQIGKPLDEAPVTLDPSARVKAHWQDAQSFVLTPIAPLKPSTRYTLNFDDSLKKRLGKIKAVSFISRPLRVDQVEGADPEWTAPLPNLLFRFNQPVSAKQVVANCHLQGEHERVALKAARDDAVGEAISATTTKPLTQGRHYTLECEAIMAQKGNQAMPEKYELELRVYPQLSLLEMRPTDGSTVAPDELQLHIRTSTPVDPEAIGKLIRLSPKVEGLRDAWVGDWESSGEYTATVTLEAKTKYTMKLASGLVDDFGQVLLKSASVTFETTDARPSLRLESGIYTLEAAARGYPVWSRNVDDLQLQCAKVEPNRVVKVLTSEVSYEPWWDESPQEEIEWNVLGLVPRAQRVGTTELKNKWQLTELDFSKLCGKGEASGVYLFDLRSEKAKAAVTDRDYGRYPYRALVNRTDLGVLLKIGHSSGLVWVSRLSDSTPVAQASVGLYSPEGFRVFQGRTDEQGVLRVPGSTLLLGRRARATSRGQEQDEQNEEGEEVEEYEEDYGGQRLIAVVQYKSDFAVVDGEWQDGILSWNFNLESDNTPGSTRIRGFIESDRGIYRSGETAHFKGLVRELPLGKPQRVPRGARVEVRVENPKDAIVLEQKYSLSPFGGFYFDLPLSTEAELGEYRVTAIVDGQRFFQNFNVEEFRPVSFEIIGDAPVGAIRLGVTHTFNFQANYLFGAKVENARVSWDVQRRKHRLRFDSYEGFGFGDSASDEDYYYWYDGEEENTSFVSDGETTTDAKGRFKVVLDDPDRKLDEPQEYLVRVRVSDATAETVSKRVMATAHKRSHYLGLKANGWVQEVGTPFSMQAIAVDLNGQRVATEATLRWSHRHWDCSQPGVGYRCTRKEKAIWSRSLEIPSIGTTAETITPDAPGEYVLALSGKDARGLPLLTSISLWVVGEGEAYWSGDRSRRMQLVANKAQYRPGETATLIARADTAGAHLLVTVERDGVIDTFTLQPSTSGEAIRIPITAAYAPNVFASVAMVRGRTGTGPEQGSYFALGVTELKVSSEQRRLQVAVKTERESYQPGERVRGTVRVLGDQVGVVSEVALSVADEGVLQLIAYQTPDPMATFYAPLQIGVENATNWIRLAKVPDPTLFGAEEGTDGAGLNPDLRSKFVSSALWLPMMVTDGEGRTNFEFDAPDNLTSFRLMAVAADAGDRFGSGESRVRVSKPLLLQPILPRFFTQGDHASIGAVLRNYTESAGEALVEASFEGLKATRKRRKVKIAKGGDAKLLFDVDVGKKAQAKVLIKATLGESSDAFEKSMPIVRPLATDRDTLFEGKLERDGTYALRWPADTDPRESQLEVTADRAGLACLDATLRYLIQYPYGCLEQTLSRLVPLLKVKDLAQSMDLEELRGGKLDRYINAGLAKVVRHQGENGHFSLWPKGRVYPHLTAYAVFGLLEAKRAGLRVDQNALEKGLEALRAFANDPARKLEPGGESATMAQAAYLLALSGQPDSGLLDRLYTARAALPLYGRALLLRALALGKAAPDLIETLLAEILFALYNGDAGWVSDHDRWTYMSTEVRDRAIVTSALIAVDPKHPHIELLISKLKQDRDNTGYFNNTQENAYALIAFADYARDKAAGNARVTLLLGDKKLTRLDVRGARVSAYVASQARLGEGELLVQTTGPVYITLRRKLVREVKNEVAIERGFEIQRAWFDEATGAPIVQAKLGQLVRVQLAVDASQDVRYLALEDPLPAGFEAVNTSLAIEAGTAERARNDDWRWRNNWDHTALRDERVEAFADVAYAGRFQYSYLMRATTVGRYIVPPARVEAMYDPVRMGSTASSSIEVVR